MKGILLHVCCGPCATQSIVELEQEGFELTLFFSNSNIHPREEYKRRLEALTSYADKIGISYFIDDYNPDKWLTEIEGHEEDPEGGVRCKICINTRLERTAQYAQSNGFEGFTTTLTISPHKNANEINLLGQQLSQKYGIKFLSKDFKKRDGFKKSVFLSKEHKLYRQNYCGCIFSSKK